MVESLAADDDYPRWRRDAFTCPNCSAFAVQKWAALVIGSGRPVEGWVPTGEHETAPGYDQDGAPIWLMARCTRCSKVSVWRGAQMLYPKARVGPPPNGQMPEGVRELYEEAQGVAATSRRAGAALARTTLERLIKDLDQDAPAKLNLDQRIERFRPSVSSELMKMLDVVRVTGNSAVHPDDEPGELVVMALDDATGPELIELLLETTNQLVDELIVRPARVHDLFDKLPEGVRASIERRRGQASREGD